MMINATLNLTQLSEFDKRLTEVEKKLLIKDTKASPYASIKEAKEYLKCSYSRVRRLIDRGFLKKNLNSRHIQILWSSIYEYVGTTSSS
jgi:hypothetical protein